MPAQSAKEGWRAIGGMASRAGVALSLAFGASIAPAADVLVISDQYGPGLDALVNAFIANGMGVTVGPTPEYQYDGWTPSPAGFAAVVHLNGSTFDQDMPLSGQQALVDYVQGGGTFIHAEWNAYEYAIGHMQLMRDLTLFDGGSYSDSFMRLELVPEPGQETNPLLVGLPLPLSFSARCDQVSLHDFGAAQPAQTIMREVGGTPAVATRSFGMGKVVGFHLAAYGADSTTLGDPAVLQLYVNAVRWATAHSGLPTISLNGSDHVVVEYDSTYVDAGATATDAEDGDLTRAIAVAGSVDTGVLGSYTITYTVVDRDGNSATATRVVTVVDTTPPVMRLLGASPLAWATGRAFVDPGATAFDAHDGDLTSRISAKGRVDAATPGVYSITYSVVDQAGNAASVTRQVQVYAAPTVTCSTSIAQLSWTGGGLSDVGLAWRVDSGRAIVSVLCSVTQDETLSDSSSNPHDAELTLANGLPSRLSLRNARLAKADGRVYLIRITAVDDLGQIGRGFCAVVVPKGGSDKQLADVQTQAAADLAARQALIVDSFGQPSANG